RAEFFGASALLSRAREVGSRGLHPTTAREMGARLPRRRGPAPVDDARDEGRGRGRPCQGLPESRQTLQPAVDPNITLAAYSERWLQLSSGLKPRTLESYRAKLSLHILPAFGSLQLRKLHRSAIKTLLAEKRATRLSVDSVRLIHAALRGMLNAAVDEGVIASNPAARLGRSMRLSRSTAERQERVRAFDAAQLARFLETAAEKAPRLAPLFFLLSRTGLRLGEALALRWEDVDLVAR